MGAQGKGNRQSRALDKLVANLADSVVRADGAIERWGDEDVYIQSMTISTIWKGRDDYMVVVRANVGGQSKVAFHAAETFYEAVKGVCDRIVNKSLAWKDDQYA